MAILPIRKVGDDVLRQVAKPVDKITKKRKKLIKDMIETMYDADGIGLAAPQIGVSERIIVVDVGEGPFALINPEIKEASGSEIDVEGCLSIPGVRNYVKRNANVVVDALDEDGKPVRIDAEGLLARCLQHEIDHLNGVLFTDKIEQVEDEEKV
ncbi:MAG: peptide deformylase [Bacillota bacterium]|jgi:peptide deformylase|nr:peptide deformylase [Bacillota bacterium]NLU53892.1 peptide deformylase [Bacillota bacterium]HOP53378.1 peptide deformylase [Bacillota bacterium]HPQ10735.1 peptide deformylase [Bacillota bacterium]HPT60629.1 peptide deformylase [Bacillota bacterium]